MKSSSDFSSIYLWKSYVDFRKSINGLSAMVQEEMELDPYSNSLYILCCQRRKKIKILYWDRTGFALWYKRLEEDLFPWPKHLDDDKLEITSRELDWILDGINIWNIKPHSDKKYSKSI